MILISNRAVGRVFVSENRGVGLFQVLIGRNKEIGIIRNIGAGVIVSIDLKKQGCRDFHLY